MDTLWPLVRDAQHWTLERETARVDRPQRQSLPLSLSNKVSPPGAPEKIFFKMILRPALSRVRTPVSWCDGGDLEEVGEDVCDGVGLCGWHMVGAEVLGHRLHVFRLKKARRDGKSERFIFV